MYSQLQVKDLNVSSMHLLLHLLSLPYILLIFMILTKPNQTEPEPLNPNLISYCFLLLLAHFPPHLSHISRPFSSTFPSLILFFLMFVSLFLLLSRSPPPFPYFLLLLLAPFLFFLLLYLLMFLILSPSCSIASSFSLLLAPLSAPFPHLLCIFLLLSPTTCSFPCSFSLLLSPFIAPLPHFLHLFFLLVQVRFHPKNPTVVASGSLDHEVRLWDSETGNCIASHDFCNTPTPHSSRLNTTLSFETARHPFKDCIPLCSRVRTTLFKTSYHSF